MACTSGSTPKLYILLNISACMFRNSDARPRCFNAEATVTRKMYVLSLLSCLNYWCWKLISVEWSLINICVSNVYYALLRSEGLWKQGRCYVCYMIRSCIILPSIYTLVDSARLCAYVMSLSQRSSAHVLTQITAVCSKVYRVMAKMCNNIQCCNKEKPVNFNGDFTKNKLYIYIYIYILLLT